MSRKGLLGCFVALALLAALATGSSAQAAGTRICEDNLGTFCASTSVYPPGTLLKGTGEIVIGGVTSCTAGIIEMEIGATGTGAESTEISKVESTTCSRSCSVKAVNTRWENPVLASGSGPNGTAEAIKAGGSPTVKSFSCSSSPVSCEYEALPPSPLSGPVIQESITGGVKAIFKGSATVKRIFGSGCPEKTGLTWVFEVSGPGPGVYVRTA